MRTSLRHTVIATALIAALPLSVATAGTHTKSPAGKAQKAKAKSKHKKDKCLKGKSYEVRGTLASGSSVTQVAGAGTAKRSDDRYSGTLVVDVLYGNKRGRRDLGVSSYAISSVPLRGIAKGAQPAVDSPIQLVGRQTLAGCTKPVRPSQSDDHGDDEIVEDDGPSTDDESGDGGSTSAEPVDPEESTDDSIRGQRLSDDEGDDSSSSDDGSSSSDDEGEDGDDFDEDASESEEATPVLDVKIKLVRFGARS